MPQARDSFNEGLKVALRMLRASDKFEAEVRARLAERGVPEDAAEKVVEHLKGKRILDDRRILEGILERNSGKRAKGLARLRAELVARGAPEELLDELLSTATLVSDRARMLAALRGKVRPGDSPDKAWRFLVGRGFDADEAREVVEEFFAE
jgi:regulatory protein